MIGQTFLKAIVVEDHPLTAAALQRFLEDEGGCGIVGHARNGKQALEMLDRQSHGIVFLDIMLPGSGGLAILEAIKSSGNPVPVIVYSGQAIGRQFHDAWHLGADALVHKSEDPDCFLRSLEAVRAGKRYVSPKISVLLGALPADHAERPVRKRLSKREQQVLDLLSDGLTTRQVAETLGVSEGTARKHRENIMTKLEARSIFELVRKAENLGLLAKPV
ncbi:response regulator transcription factor [Hoeflea sp.]|uniref:response regulator transcription factor n=1 Tax=Hoeflea sp. TaxID=1940281 RepID=UPI003B51AA6C